MGNSRRRTIASIFGVLACSPALAQVTRRASVSSSGSEASGESFSACVSASGRFVAFVSDAADLVPVDTNGWARDVFVRDLGTGTTTLASLDQIGNQHIGHCRLPSISADGSVIAYQTRRTGPDDTGPPSDYDVFARNRTTGVTTLASVAVDGGLANGNSEGPSVSLDGRYVVFSSRASNLVPGDTNARYDIFVRDLLAGTTERVSVSTSGVQGKWDAGAAGISANGSRVAFASESTNMIDGVTTGSGAVFVRDRARGTTSQVSLTSTGSQPDSWSALPSISADGTLVAFVSYATTLVPGDTNGFIDVFVRDLEHGTTERVSVSSNGAQGSGHSGIDGGPAISPDGRLVAFPSLAPDLVTGDANGVSDVFVHDRKIGETWRASSALSGFAGAGISICGRQSLSSLGQVMVFSSIAGDLVPVDLNGLLDVFATTPGSFAPAVR